MEAASWLRFDGRPLAAGNAGLPVPEEAHLALWHACTLVREHRFDGHVAALTVNEVDGLAALRDGRRRPAGGSTPPRCAGSAAGPTTSGPRAPAGLRERGLLDASGALTPDGRRLHTNVEDATDRLAETPWDHLAADRRERLFALLADLAARLEGEGGLVYPNPIGVSRPA